MKTSNLACLLGVLLTVDIVRAESPTAKPEDVAAIAKQAWAITDMVLDKDIDAPARQQMLLLGLKGLLRDAGKPLPSTLATRISQVTTMEQLAALLKEVWPAGQSARRTEDEKQEYALFRGLLNQRPHEHESAYLSPRNLEAYDVTAFNRYVGTGIQIRRNDKEKLTQIVLPFAGGPARKAGARPDDLILAVDDDSMADKPLVEVVRRLQGKEGTKVSMTVRQPGESKTRRLAMVRSVIPFPSVEGYRRTGEESWSFRPDSASAIAYLSVNDIKSSTPMELQQIARLVQGEEAKALVLDLRFTRGSEMHHASLLADSLLDGGVMWRVKDNRGRLKEYKADRDCLFRDLPMVVLVSEHTGSLAALVAAALQDRGRAIVVGQAPKADLTVTSLVRLPEGQGALLLRTGAVERMPRKSAAKTELQRLAEAENRVLPDKLVDIERKEIIAVQEWMRQQESPEPKTDAKPPTDPQLEKALTLLREALAKSPQKTKE